MLLGGALRAYAKAPTRGPKGAHKAQRGPRECERGREGGMDMCVCRHLEVDVDVDVHVEQILPNAVGRGYQNTCKKHQLGDPMGSTRPRGTQESDIEGGRVGGRDMYMYMYMDMYM